MAVGRTNKSEPSQLSQSSCVVCVCIAAARGARFQIDSGGPGGTAQRPQFAQYARSEAARWSVAGRHCVYRRRRDGRSDDRLQVKVFGTA